MNKDLNSIQGRILAARNAVWRRFLMDRRYMHTSDENQEVDYLPARLVYSINA